MNTSTTIKLILVLLNIAILVGCGTLDNNRRDPDITQNNNTQNSNNNSTPTYTRADNNDVQMGNEALKNGNPQVAIESYTKAISENPELVDAYKNRAVAYMQLNEFNNALSDFDRALQYGEDPETLYNLGTAYLQNAFFEPAIMIFEHLKSLTPQDPYLLNNLGLALAGLDRWDDSIAVYNELIQINPGMIEAHNNQGTSYRGKQSYSEAISKFEQVLTLSPNDANALFNLGDVYQVMGNSGQSVHYYQRYLDARPDAPDAAKVRARIQKLSGNNS